MAELKSGIAFGEIGANATGEYDILKLSRCTVLTLGHSSTQSRPRPFDVLFPRPYIMFHRGPEPYQFGFSLRGSQSTKYVLFRQSPLPYIN